MKNLVCEHIKRFIRFVFIISLVSISHSFAQCLPDQVLGTNLVTNGDFSNDYTGWTYTSGAAPAGYHVKATGTDYGPGNIYVGLGSDMAYFNPAFTHPFNGHNTGAANDKFLMVDGVCTVGIKLWSQSAIPVVANTRYYFSVWINSLQDQPNYPGLLNFAVDGIDLKDISNSVTIIQAPAIGGGNPGGNWKLFEAYWDSGTTPPAIVTLSIEGSQTIGCNTESDFAIDDIKFIPGCGYTAPGPQPDLGPDQSICAGGPVTIHAGVTPTATTTVTWSANAPGVNSGYGLGAPYSKVITAPGTYSVCVKEGSGCTKSDVIVISGVINAALGGPYNLCVQVSQPLDPGFSGSNVTYKWYKDGLDLSYDHQVYTATSPGTYSVDVIAAPCPTKTVSTVVTSSSQITPIDAYYCATSSSVSGKILKATTTGTLSNLVWYTTATGSSVVPSSIVGMASQITVPSISQGTTGDITYYVQDNSFLSGSVGPTVLPPSPAITADGAGNAFNLDKFGIFFTPYQDFTLNSVQIPIARTTVTGGPMTISVKLGVYINGLLNTPTGGTATTTMSTISSTVTINSAAGVFNLQTFNFTGFNIPASVGANALLKIVSITSNYSAADYGVGNTTGGTSFPYHSTIAGVVDITQSLSNWPPTTAKYFGLYNWQISSGSNCARVPVRVINNCVTPVTWTSFYLVPQNNACKLVWSTAEETNNAYFLIQRSADGIHFESIARIVGAGNRDIASNYYYIDYAPLSGTSYYRITQIDYDGSSSATDMKSYSAESLIQVTTYPNPFQYSTSLLVSGPTEETYTYTLYAVSGQLVEKGSGAINQVQTIAETVVKGMYMLTVMTTSEISTSKIVKQ